MTKERTFPAARGLAVASLEIGRVLADRDGVTFRAQGTCMYPTIRPGDVLRIRSCTASDAALGDIAVCRTPAYLFSHRVIARGEKDGRPYVVTRPDRSAGPGDGPVFDENLLGVVISAQRSGRPVPLQPERSGWLGRRFDEVRLALIEATPWLLDLRAAMLRSRSMAILQGGIALAWFKLSRPSIRFVVRVPLNATLGDEVFRPIDASAFDPASSWEGREIVRWILIARIDDSETPAAWATFARGSMGSWALEDSHIRLRYRGTGIDSLLMETAGGIMARER